ncbi:helix-turn-helix transcriptional regulator [Devosia sp.]|uniref:ArsR/SmtB family transcription factor n=1 Tax=Devosia sp. TaxID=1871048 RepID=UPI002733FFCB|nr:helix-turn-helix domain-containing protein [Devosia sp.]MDP2781900.1 helix-turn-helix domain-containing protein [Devosia sp.]
MRYEDALKILVALGNPGRFDIFRRVGETPGLSSSDLKSGKAASTTSHHIKLLVDAGVLETARDGKYVRYNVHRGKLASFAKWAAAQAELATFDDLTKYLSDNSI